MMSKLLLTLVVCFAALASAFGQARERGGEGGAQQPAGTTVTSTSSLGGSGQAFGLGLGITRETVIAASRQFGDVAIKGDSGEILRTALPFAEYLSFLPGQAAVISINFEANRGQGVEKARIYIDRKLVTESDRRAKMFEFTHGTTKGYFDLGDTGLDLVLRGLTPGVHDVTIKIEGAVGRRTDGVPVLDQIPVLGRIFRFGVEEKGWLSTTFRINVVEHGELAKKLGGAKLTRIQETKLAENVSALLNQNPLRRNYLTEEEACQLLGVIGFVPTTPAPAPPVKEIVPSSLTVKRVGEQLTISLEGADPLELEYSYGPDPGWTFNVTLGKDKNDRGELVGMVYLKAVHTAGGKDHPVSLRFRKSGVAEWTTLSVPAPGSSEEKK